MDEIVGNSLLIHATQATAAASNMYAGFLKDLDAAIRTL